MSIDLRKIFLIILTAVIAALLFVKCSTVHKTIDETKSKKDSVVHQTVATQTVRHADSTGYIKKRNYYHKTITVNFSDSTKKKINVGDTSGTWTIADAIEYLARPTHKTIIGRDTINTNGNVKSITESITGDSLLINSSHNISNNATSTNQNNNVKVVTDNSTFDKKVKRTGAPLWIYLGGIGALAAFVLWLIYGNGWAILIGFLKRKKNNNA